MTHYPKLNYHTTSLIHLSLEEYYGLGMSPESAKAAIEGIRDVGFGGGSSGLKLWCTSSGINKNWSVQTQATNPDDIRFLVNEIRVALDSLLPVELRGFGFGMPGCEDFGLDNPPFDDSSSHLYWGR